MVITRTCGTGMGFRGYGYRYSQNYPWVTHAEHYYQHINKNLLFEGPAVDPVAIEARRSNHLRCNIPDILDGMQEVEMDDEFESIHELVTEEQNIVGTGMYLAFVLQT